MAYTKNSNWNKNDCNCERTNTNSSVNVFSSKGVSKFRDAKKLAVERKKKGDSKLVWFNGVAIHANTTYKDYKHLRKNLKSYQASYKWSRDFAKKASEDEKGLFALKSKQADRITKLGAKKSTVAQLQGQLDGVQHELVYRDKKTGKKIVQEKPKQQLKFKNEEVYKKYLIKNGYKRQVVDSNGVVFEVYKK